MLQQHNILTPNLKLPLIKQNKRYKHKIAKIKKDKNETDSSWKNINK